MKACLPHWHTGILEPGRCSIRHRYTLSCENHWFSIPTSSHQFTTTATLTSLLAALLYSLRWRVWSMSLLCVFPFSWLKSLHPYFMWTKYLVHCKFAARYIWKTALDLRIDSVAHRQLYTALSWWPWAQASCSQHVDGPTFYSPYPQGVATTIALNVAWTPPAPTLQKNKKLQWKKLAHSVHNAHCYGSWVQEKTVFCLVSLLLLLWCPLLIPWGPPALLDYVYSWTLQAIRPKIITGPVSCDPTVRFFFGSYFDRLWLEARVPIVVEINVSFYQWVLVEIRVVGTAIF